MGLLAWMAAGALALAGTALGGEADPFAEFVSPISNPVNFEDPRPTTEVRPIYAYHRIDDDFATQGGEAHVAAAQARVALGDRLGLVATKDGYVTLRPDAVLPERNGWANIAFGATERDRPARAASRHLMRASFSR